jgi:hypothetical protein
MTTKYLYVKHWEYADPILLEVFHGLPKVGCVYKTEMNPSTNQYFLQFKEGNIQILLPDLIRNNAEQDGYNCELVELSKSNILDLNLEETELDKIISWTTMIPQNEQLQVFQQAHLQMQHEQAERMAYVYEALSRLDMVNSIHVDILHNTAEMLEEKNLMNPEDDISLDENHGLGVNISRAQEALNRYSGPDRRTNEDPTDLYEALYHIVREIERRDINDLD